MTEIRLEKSLPSEQERVGQPSVPAEGLERYFAREGVDPLPYAFEGKIAVHPGLGGSGVEKQDFEATLEPLLAVPRTGKTVAYIHVPFCETHCLYCGFYNKAYREDESRIYADALIQELRLWRGRPGQDAGPVHAVYMGGGTPTALQADDLRCCRSPTIARSRWKGVCRISARTRWKRASRAGQTVFHSGCRALTRRSGRRWAACPIATR